MLTGVLRLGDEIEIRPGIVTKDTNGQIKCSPIFSRVVSLLAEQNDLKFACPGGLVSKMLVYPLLPIILTSLDRRRYTGRSHLVPRGSTCRPCSGSQGKATSSIC